jgi:hypothetical protein
MAAQTSERDTLQRGEAPREFDDLPMAASTTIWQGSMVAVNAAGNAIPGSTSTTIKRAGRAEATKTNSGAAGAELIRIQRGCFRYGNSTAGDAITNADRYADCYIVDDQTVAKTDGTGTRSVAGKVVDVDSIGVWVQIDPLRS